MITEHTEETISPLLTISNLLLNLQKNINDLSEVDSHIIQSISDITNHVLILENENKKLTERVLELEEAFIYDKEIQ